MLLGALWVVYAPVKRLSMGDEVDTAPGASPAGVDVRRIGAWNLLMLGGWESQEIRMLQAA